MLRLNCTSDRPIGLETFLPLDIFPMLDVNEHFCEFLIRQSDAQTALCCGTGQLFRGEKGARVCLLVSQCLKDIVTSSLKLFHFKASKADTDEMMIFVLDVLVTESV